MTYDRRKTRESATHSSIMTFVCGEYRGRQKPFKSSRREKPNFERIFLAKTGNEEITPLLLDFSKKGVGKIPDLGLHFSFNKYFIEIRCP